MKRTAAAVWAFVLFAGCSPAPPPDILLVTIDTLRADHVSASGDARAPATPAFDSVAARGLLFEQAIAPAPLTLPSHASILTGQWPFQHGVRDNGGFRLDPSVPTLAEALRSRGYKTAAFVGAFVLDSRFGLGRGFDTYDDDVSRPSAGTDGIAGAPARPGSPHADPPTADFPPAPGAPGYLGDPRRDGGAVAAAVSDWIDIARPEPIFVWVHLYDPHAPYEPPPDLARQYPGRPYAAAVAHADAALGKILAEWERRPRASSSIVAVTADHGESLGGHGEETHGVFVYDATLRVPLALRAPGLAAGRRIPWQARLIDLAPTILGLAGPQRPSGTASRPRADSTVPTGAAGDDLAADGVDLGPALRRGAPPPDLPAYAESLFGTYHYGWSPLRALRAGGLKWIEAPRPELYDLAADPGETRNLHTGAPRGGEPAPHPTSEPRGSSLAEALVALAGPLAVGSAGPPSGHTAARRTVPAPRAEDAETLARLRGLGYVGAGAARTGAGPLGAGSPAAGTAAAGTAASLPDPKDGIADHAAFEAGFLQAGKAFDRGEYAAAGRLASSLLARFPQARDALRLRALAALNEGNLAAAGRDLDRLLAEDPRDAEALAARAILLERSGKRAEAIGAYEAALAAGPGSAMLRVRAARLLRLEGRLDEADARLREALDLEPASPAAAYERALILLARGDRPAAETLLRRAAQGTSPPRGAHHNLALLLEERSDLEAARREYEAEIAAHPQAAASHLNLGLLLERLGDRGGALARLEAAAALSPADPRPLTALAALLLREPGGEARSRDLLRRALRADPTYEPARRLAAESGLTPPG
jgi:arylsulfatase A-like enzyme/Flp pilus assembly protein TadD